MSPAFWVVHRGGGACELGPVSGIWTAVRRHHRRHPWLIDQRSAGSRLIWVLGMGYGRQIGQINFIFAGAVTADLCFDWRQRVRGIPRPRKLIKITIYARNM